MTSAFLRLALVVSIALGACSDDARQFEPNPEAADDSICGEIATGGICDDGAALWCNEGVLISQSCNCGSSCEINSDGVAFCTEEIVTEQGECSEDLATATYCDDSGEVVMWSCGEGEACTTDDASYATCAASQ